MQRIKVASVIVIALLGMFCVCATVQADGGQVSVTLGSVQGLPGEKNKEVAITVSNLTGMGVIAADITLIYDPSALTLNSLSTANTIAKTWSSPVYNNAIPGKAVIALFGTQALSGEGVLLKVSFNVNDKANVGPSNLTLAKMKLNGGKVAVSSIKNGVFTVGTGTKGK